MNITATGMNSFTNAVNKTSNLQTSMAASTLKGAINAPEQYMQLLEQSIAVKNSNNIASSMGIVDVTI